MLVGFLLAWALITWVRECLFYHRSDSIWTQLEGLCIRLSGIQTSVLELFESPIGKGEAIEAILAALEVVSEPFRSFANTLVDVCAYAGLCLSFSASPLFS